MKKNKIIKIEGGKFLMGFPVGGAGKPEDKGPGRMVKVGAFYLCKYQVTQEQWMEVMGTNPSEFVGDNLPVEGVSWYDAVNYCNALSVQHGLAPCYLVDKRIVAPNWYANGFRLPSEAEWEFAARGGNASKGYLYAGSDNADEVAWHGGTLRGGRTYPVGEKAPNELGLHDMTGNVSEWCWDWFGDYSSENWTPRGPFAGVTRVVRGGNWFSKTSALRSIHRHSVRPDMNSDTLGFRLARSSVL